MRPVYNPPGCTTSTVTEEESSKRRTLKAGAGGCERTTPQATLSGSLTLRRTALFRRSATWTRVMKRSAGSAQVRPGCRAWLPIDAGRHEDGGAPKSHPCQAAGDAGQVDSAGARRRPSADPGRRTSLAGLPVDPVGDQCIYRSGILQMKEMPDSGYGFESAAVGQPVGMHLTDLDLDATVVLAVEV